MIHVLEKQWESTENFSEGHKVITLGKTTLNIHLGEVHIDSRSLLHSIDTYKHLL